MSTEEERIAEAVAKAVKATEERTRIALQLETIGESLEKIVLSQQGQVIRNEQDAVTLGEIKTRLDGIDARLKSHSIKIDNIEKAPGRRGMVSGATAGTGVTAILWAIIEWIKSGGTG